MAGELLLRFLLGGTIVSLFALVGTICKPKTFAGIFGSAPSVALATLLLAWVKEGPDYAAVECQSMAIGTVGLAVYCLGCAALAARAASPIWLDAGASWLIWAGVAFGLWSLLHAASLLG